MTALGTVAAAFAPVTSKMENGRDYRTLVTCGKMSRQAWARNDRLRTLGQPDTSPQSRM
jgi:hypothetical protein